MPHSYCCVPNCTNSTQILNLTFRSLPIHNPEIYQIWVDRIGHKEMKICTDLKKAYRRWKVCNDHFSKFCTSPGEKRLKRDSLPTLFLPYFLKKSTERNSLHRYLNSDEDEVRDDNELSKKRPASNFTADDHYCKKLCIQDTDERYEFSADLIQVHESSEKQIEACPNKQKKLEQSLF